MRTAVLLLLIPSVASGAEKPIDPAVAAAWGWSGDPTGEGPNPHTPYDPYGHGTYESFRKAVEAGGKGILIVGIADKYVGGSTVHCWVKTGWEGFADGEYDCFILNGKAVMEPRKEGKPVAVPKAQESGTTPTTPVIVAVGRSTSSSDTYCPGVTFTLAPRAGIPGNTDSPPGQP